MKVASPILRRGLALVSYVLCSSWCSSVPGGARPRISDMFACWLCLLLPLVAVRVDSGWRAYFMTCAGVSGNLISTLWIMQYLLGFP